jgi:TonB-dependent SusC/RagA subfamily outer membrane receptor
MKTIIPLLLILCFSVTSFGQKNSRKITITGTVVSASNAPVEGAVIFIDKVKTNSVTDQQGHYKVKASSDAKKILALSLFYGASEAAIEGKEVIDFVLTGKSEENAAQKDKSQQSISGNAEKNKNSGKPLGAVDGQSQEFASAQSIFDMIKGRFPGVEVSGTSIKISGSSSLNASTEPLFVVDGIIVNSIEDIAPQTVKSIEVLKGPEASVYGMRGANGVIVINRITGKDIK